MKPWQSFNYRKDVLLVDLLLCGAGGCQYIQWHIVGSNSSHAVDVKAEQVVHACMTILAGHVIKMKPRTRAYLSSKFISKA